MQISGKQAFPEKMDFSGNFRISKLRPDLDFTHQEDAESPPFYGFILSFEEVVSSQTSCILGVFAEIGQKPIYRGPRAQFLSKVAENWFLG